MDGGWRLIHPTLNYQAELGSEQIQPPTFADLLVGFHGPQQVNYAAVSVNFAHTPPACQIIWNGNIPTDGLNDIEGLAYDPF